MLRYELGVLQFALGAPVGEIFMPLEILRQVGLEGRGILKCLVERDGETHTGGYGRVWYVATAKSLEHAGFISVSRC